MKLDKKIVGWLVFYGLVMLVYAVFSYSLVTPNLILLANENYMIWQQWMWQSIGQNRTLLAWLYGGLVTLMWVAYFGLMRTIDQQNKATPKKQLTGRNYFWIILFSAGPLLISYNALSADVFNYIFNARMVVEYGANPHLQVALDFPEDEMVRFLHNSHTAAPYGYGWTGLSLPFYLMGLGKFILQWLAMRIAAILSFSLTGWLIWTWAKVRDQGRGLTAQLNAAVAKFGWVFLNPLLLIEIISNDHNDLWMVMPAVASLYLIDEQKKKTAARILLSAALLFFSTQIKFATLVIVPFWLYLAGGRELLAWLKQKWTELTWLKKIQSWGEKYFFDLIALAMFVPLLTARSQWFHPWYLSWSLVWLPFCRWRWTRITLIAFSISSLYRYLPFLTAGGYGETVLAQQRWMTFGLAGLLVLLIWVTGKIKKPLQKQSASLKN